ncbi:superinfection exclusion B family protein [Muricauda sp. NFXS6]|uniref:superinfection exclusion B family protein n=1 Tax=Flavobacteriaceae TaxID=49546 RepID=UPI0032DFA328
MEFSFFKGLFDINKIPAKLALVFAVVSGVLLFFPEDTLKKLQADQFVSEYGLYIGTVFLFSTALTIINVGIWFQKQIRYQIELARAKSRIKYYIRNLSPREKSVLREFYIVGNTIKMPYDNPVVSGLIENNIIRPVSLFQSDSSFIIDGHYTSMTLGDYARKIIKPKYVDLMTPEMTEEEKAKIISERPPWAGRH